MLHNWRGASPTFLRHHNHSCVFVHRRSAPAQPVSSWTVGRGRVSRRRRTIVNHTRSRTVSPASRGDRRDRGVGDSRERDRARRIPHRFRTAPHHDGNFHISKHFDDRRPRLLPARSDADRAQRGSHVFVRFPECRNRSDAWRHRHVQDCAGGGLGNDSASRIRGQWQRLQHAVADRLCYRQRDVRLRGAHGRYCVQQWYICRVRCEIFSLLRAWLRARAIFPTIGNHDDMTSSATPYRTLFVLPRDGARPRSRTTPNVSTASTTARCISSRSTPKPLSCHRRAGKSRSPGLPQISRRRRVSRGGSCSFTGRRTASGTEHGSDLAIRQAFGPLFEQYNVQFVLNGHEHSFERSVPWRESTNTARQAVTYIVTGGGGAVGYPVGRSPWTAFARAVPHYVRMTISPTDATLEAVGANGAVLDRFTLNPSQQKSDTVAPQVSIVSPGSGATLSGNANVTVSADDDVRVEKVDLWLDGQLRAIDLTEPYCVHDQHDDTHRWNAFDRSARLRHRRQARVRGAQREGVERAAGGRHRALRRRGTRARRIVARRHRQHRRRWSPPRTSRGRRRNHRPATRQPAALRRARSHGRSR